MAGVNDHHCHYLYTRLTRQKCLGPKVPQHALLDGEARSEGQRDGEARPKGQRDGEARPKGQRDGEARPKGPTCCKNAGCRPGATGSRPGWPMPKTLNTCKSALWAGGRPGATGSGRERIKPLMVKQCPKGPIQLINIVLFVFMLLLHFASCAQQKYEHTASAHQRDQNSACIYHSPLGNVRIRRLKLFVMLLVVLKPKIHCCVAPCCQPTCCSLS